MANITNEDVNKSNLSRGNLLFTSGEYESAIKQYNLALKMMPNLFVIHDNIGWCYERLNDRLNASKFYEKALELNPNSIRANLFFNRNPLLKTGKVENEQLFFPQIHAASAAIDKQPLKDEYFNKKLELKQDDFALIRIIGNDLYPRHKIGQSRENVTFILENEPSLDCCRKVWILNRIFDLDELSKLTTLLQKHNQEYHIIPFVEEEYKKVSIDYSLHTSENFLQSKEFEKLGNTAKQRVLVSMLRLKNNYVMNNNGARNYALNLGKTIAKWTMPWDGNCFINKDSWNAIKKNVLEEPYLKHFLVPMARITSNELLLNDNYMPNAIEEPQIIFRQDSNEQFNEEYSYGRRPKVELFWRLGIPGVWDTFKDDPWDPPRLARSKEANQFGVAGWTTRLFSGMAEQETQDNKGSSNRNSARQLAIVSAIDHIDNLLNIVESQDNKLELIKNSMSLPYENNKLNIIQAIEKIDNGRNFSFLANRNDGLGARLGAILNAIVMAKIFQRKFHVYWPSEVSVGKEFHVIDSAKDTFSQKYVEEHFVGDDFLIVDKNAQVSNVENVKDFFAENEIDVYLCHQNEKFKCLHDLSGIDATAYKEAFESIKFNESINQSILAAKSVNIGQKAVAIHIRGGDIVYGRYRLSRRYQQKALCYSLAIALIDKLTQQGFTPVIFLQDKAIENALRNEKLNNLVLAKDFSNDFDLKQQAFFDIALMSRCQIIIAGSSSFSDVAARISGIKVDKPSKYLTKNESLNAIKTWLTREDKIDKYQHSFALLNYVLIGEETLTVKEIDNVLTQAEENDPENGLYTAIRILNFWTSNDFYTANKIVQNYFEHHKSEYLRRLPMISALSVSNFKGLRIQNDLDSLPTFNLLDFKDLGLVYCYLKHSQNKHGLDDKHLDFLNKIPIENEQLSKYAKILSQLDKEIDTKI